ncbi:MAG TPA: lysophospholipase [Rhizomicrobium sp.]|nr:lysophospholipase [Rhizomicrobium sp.]
MVRTRTPALLAAARAACVVAVAALAACAPRLAAHGLETTAPVVAQDAFVTRDGLRLPLRRWDSPSPVAVVVALHGMSDYSNAFEAPATWWAEHGLITYAYDQRGFGRAPHPGLWAGGDALRQDLSDFVLAVRAAHPGLPVFALGESMGGAVVLSALASAHPPRVDGAILVAPAVWSRKDMPFSYRAALWSVAHVAPWMTFTGRGLNIWPSDNIEMLKKLARDPLFQHRTRADAIWGLANLMDDAYRAPAGLADPPPILLLYGAKDQIIPAKATDEAIAALGARAEVRRYAHGYHMLLRDLEGPTVWSDVLDWIARRSTPVR